MTSAAGEGGGGEAAAGAETPPPDTVREALEGFDLDASTPMDAFDLIRRLKDET